MRKETVEDWVSKTKLEMGGCWILPNKPRPDGYVRICLGKGKNVYAHRFFYEMLIGDIDDGLNVLHHCDNPRCVCPDHLFLGTQKDNAIDREIKGRGQHPRDHLTSNDVKKIRERRGESPRKLGEEFGVTHWTIYDVWSKRSWSWI